MKKLLPLVLLFGFLGWANAQVILIDGSNRNGFFNDDITGTDQTSFADTDFWDSLGPDQTIDATRTNILGPDGSRCAVIAEGRIAAGNHTGTDTGYTLGTGDVLTVSFEWRDAFNWNDASDKVAVFIFTTDDDTITGTRSIIETLLVPLSTANNTWEFFLGEFTAILPANDGKRLFTGFRSEDGNGTFNGFGRLDDFILDVTASTSDPVLTSTSGNYAFGTLHHNTALDTTARTMTFQNIGPTNSLTIDAVTWNNDAGGIFSVTSTTPSLPAVIPVGGTLEVEVTATGGGGYTAYVGELLIDTTPDDQDTTVPVTATISTDGDPVNSLFLDNPNMDLFTAADPGIDPNDDGEVSIWNGFSVHTAGLKSTNGARLKGTGDPSLDPATNLWDNLAQTFQGEIFPDFQATVCFAIPDFDAWTGSAPSAVNRDRSFHLAILGTTTLTAGGDYDDVQTADAIIDLFYLADGISGDTGPGFFLYDGASFVRQAGLGTLLESTGFTGTGEPPTTLNTYQLTITGDDFGTAGASYDIEISDANMTNVAASVTGVTTFHSLDPTTTTAKAIVLTTSDVSTATGDVDLNTPVIQQASFWVDQVVVAVPANLPIASWDLTSPPNVVKTLGDEILTTSFTVANTGIGSDLTVDNPVIGDAKFTITSPSFPVNIPVGASQVFDVQVDLSGETTEQNFATTLTLTTNDFIQTTRVLDLEGQVLPTGTRLLVDYDDGLANGIHESSLRNGGFEDGVDLQTLLDTPIWTSAFTPEGDTITGTLSTEPATGLLHSQATGFSGAGERAQPTQIFTASDWTLQAGDTVSVEYKAKAGAAYDGLNPQVIIEVIDENGAFVNDPVNFDSGAQSRWIVHKPPFTAAGATYETFSFTTNEIQPGSTWIGNRIRVRFLKGGARSAFVNVDDISITAQMKLPGALEITAIAFNPTTKDVTIRFVDSGAASYSIESDADLIFPAGTTTYPLDGSEDTVTYPDEIEFTFNDPTATGTFHGWRVIAP